MEFKQPFKTLGSLGVTAAVGLLGALALGSPAQAQTNIDLNPDHRDKTAGYFEEHCGEDYQLPDDQGANEDGWVFVLPGQGSVFLELTAVFADANGDEHTLDAKVVTTGNSGNSKHAYIITPAGWTLMDATADIEGSHEFFNVTHTCPGEPGEEESSPDGETTAPGEESSEPGEPGGSIPVCVDESGAPTESPSDAATTEQSTSAEAVVPSESVVPCEEATSPAAGNGNLPTTGTPLTIALVSAAALAAGGAALFMIQRRRREAQDW